MNNTCAVTADLNRYYAQQERDDARMEAITELADEIVADIMQFENAYHVDCFWEDFYEDNSDTGMWCLMQAFLAMANKQGGRDAGIELWSQVEEAANVWAAEYAEKHIDD